MIQERRPLLSPASRAVVLTLLVIGAIPYVLLFAAVCEYLLLGTQHLVNFYRAIGIAELLDWIGTNTIGRLAGG